MVTENEHSNLSNLCGTTPLSLALLSFERQVVRDDASRSRHPDI